MNNTKISVIIPVYKVEPYLRKCLDSIVNQTYENIEIILVDDGSPDNCGVICDEYEAADNRITVIHKENGGLASARNAGLKAVTGDWIGWVDSDDWVRPDMFEYLINGAQKYHADVAICGRVDVHPRYQILWEGEKEEVLNTEAILFSLLDIGNRKIENYMWDKLWKKELFDGITYPEGKNFEDFAVSYRLLEKANTIVYLPEAKYYYLQRTGSIMADWSLKNQLDRYDMAKMRYDGLKDRWPQFEQILLERCVSLAGSLWSSYYKSSREEREDALPHLREISSFLRPYIKEHKRAENQGLGGQLMRKMVCYPYWWAFVATRLIKMIFKWKNFIFPKKRGK